MSEFSWTWVKPVTYVGHLISQTPVGWTNMSVDLAYTLLAGFLHFIQASQGLFSNGGRTYSGHMTRIRRCYVFAMHVTYNCRKFGGKSKTYLHMSYDHDRRPLCWFLHCFSFSRRTRSSFHLPQLLQAAMHAANALLQNLAAGGSLYLWMKGATENARLELSSPSKMQDWNYRHQTAGWKMRDQAVMESQTQRSVALTSYLLRLTQHDLSNYLSEFTM